MEPFIKPYQLNYIRKQISQLLRTVYFIGDYRVYAAMKQSVYDNIVTLFPYITAEQSALFKEVPELRGQDQVKPMMDALGQYVIPFRSISPDDIKRLFPKVKKLVMPDFAQIDFANTTYLGWRDIATNSLYIVYEKFGELIGVQCKYVAGSKRATFCCLCGQGRQGHEAGLVTAVTRAKNYTSVGNHMCLNADVCNRDITSIDEIELFLDRATTR